MKGSTAMAQSLLFQSFCTFVSILCLLPVNGYGARRPVPVKTGKGVTTHKPVLGFNLKKTGRGGSAVSGVKKTGLSKADIVSMPGAMMLTSIFIKAPISKFEVKESEQLEPGPGGKKLLKTRYFFRACSFFGKAESKKFITATVRYRKNMNGVDRILQRRLTKVWSASLSITLEEGHYDSRIKRALDRAFQVAAGCDGGKPFTLQLIFKHPLMLDLSRTKGRPTLTLNVKGNVIKGAGYARPPR